jgi:4-amino-4-deoxy-L-arabinose transferase-like glycosyltransferase
MTSRIESRPWLVWAVLAAILLLAAGLRFFRLDGQSMWADEGTSVALSGRSLTAITRGAAKDIHPPLYYYLLHFWTAALGTSVTAVRGLSALLGTLLVAATFGLGRKLYGRAVGLSAAFLAAISPFQVYYSQEARMYILVALLGALSTLLMVWLLERLEEGGNPVLPAALYVAAAAGCLYSHYFGFTILLAQNLGFLVWLAGGGRGRWKALAIWASLQAVAVGTFAPWLRLTLGQLRTWPAVSEGFGAPELARRALEVFSLGLSADATYLVPAMAAFALLLLVGLATWWPRERSWRPRAFPVALAALCFAVPIIVMYVLSRQRPMYNPKFILLATTGYLILAGRGAAALAGARRWRAPAAILAGVLSAVIVAASTQSLGAYYFDPAHARDDYRSIASYIEAAAQPGDAILLNAPGQGEIFHYYYGGDLEVYPLPGGRPLDPQLTRQELEDLADDHAGQRAFAVLWATDESDPERFIEGWLDGHAYKASDTWYGNVRLVVYALPKGSPSDQPEHEVGANLGDRVILDGYTLLTPQVRAGDIVQIALYWRAQEAIQRRYKVFVHLLDAGGKVVGQHDAEPGGGARLTTTWEEGESVEDNYGVLVEPGTPPGRAEIEVGMYDLETGERLPVLEGGEAVDTRVLLGAVQIDRVASPPSMEMLRMEHLAGMELGPLRLLGYDLCRLGQPCEEREIFHPGDVIQVVLYWQAEEKPEKQAEVVLSLVDDRGKVVASHHGEPVDGRYPITEWEEGEVVRDQKYLFLPSDVQEGECRLRLGASDGELTELTRMEVAGPQG